MRWSLQALLALAVWAEVTWAQASSTDCEIADDDVYQFSLDNMDGTELPLSDYRGKVLMLFNSATY